MVCFFTHHVIFLSIFITAIFSVLFGIALKVILADYGVILAFVLWGVAFASDFLSTVSIPNYKTHETNQLFHIFSRFLPNGMSFLLIAVISFLIQYVVFLWYDDLIITYIVTVACFCTVLSNIHYRKNLLKYNSSIYNMTNTKPIIKITNYVSSAEISGFDVDIILKKIPGVNYRPNGFPVL